MAAALQHRPAPQRPGIPAPGSRGLAALCGRFGYASATAQGWSIGRPTPNLKPGAIRGGRSDRNAAAVATPRGSPTVVHSLAFVRVEPFVVPKKSLTGDNSERVDTRVLQVIYECDPEADGNGEIGRAHV